MAFRLLLQRLSGLGITCRIRYGSSVPSAFDLEGLLLPSGFGEALPTGSIVVPFVG